MHTLSRINIVSIIIISIPEFTISITLTNTRATLLMINGQIRLKLPRLSTNIRVVFKTTKNVQKSSCAHIIFNRIWTIGFTVNNTIKTSGLQDKQCILQKKGLKILSLNQEKRFTQQMKRWALFKMKDDNFNLNKQSETKGKITLIFILQKGSINVVVYSSKLFV